MTRWKPFTTSERRCTSSDVGRRRDLPLEDRAVDHSLTEQEVTGAVDTVDLERLDTAAGERDRHHITDAESGRLGET